MKLPTFGISDLAHDHRVWGALIALYGLSAWSSWRKERRALKGGRGGSGKVVGVVGRMGSGKSYFAVRMAYRRLCEGYDVCSNFSMFPEKLFPPRRWWLPITRKRVNYGRWIPFRGWEQMADLENAIVIVDEAHLYAPSSKSLQFPMVARFKLSMARKFHLDVYWITQHEDRVNRTIRDLTNLIYVCNAWFDHLAFSAKGYEPEKMRRKDQHIDRRAYLFSTRIAGLYDTLEVLHVDDHLADETVERAHQAADAYNARRRGTTRPQSGESEGRANDTAAAAQEPHEPLTRAQRLDVERQRKGNRTTAA